MIFYLKNTKGYKMDLFKGKKYDEILPIFQAKFDANMKILFKSKEEMEKEDEEIMKSINETPAQKAAKRRKLSKEAQEADDLRKRLDIVQDEDDDVFVEATPLAQKVIDNKPKYKIIKADNTHQFYISFTTLLKNFDREDLEALWKIVRDRFSTSKPTNFLDEYMLLTLKIMFEEPDGQDAIWRNQKSVHVQLFSLVERRVKDPLSKGPPQKERVKFLEDKQGEGINISGDDASIKGKRLDEEEVATKRVSSYTKEIRLDEGEVVAEKVVPTAIAVAPANVSISTGSGVVPTAKKMVETHTPKKKKRLQEQIDIQFGIELEEELEREAQRMNAQIARDEEIAKIHAKDELKQMIEGLDRSNETIAKHLEEYEQAAGELTIRERIELISELVKYQDHHFKILQYQAQQRKTMTKKQKRDFYMAVIRNNLGWKMEDFIPMGSKEEGESIKRKGFNLEQESAKKQKTSEEVPKEAISLEEVTKEKVKEMIQLVLIEEVYAEALQVKHPTIDWKTLSNRPPTSEKEMELWVELNRMYEHDKEDQIWTHTHNLMHASVDWRLYDSCGVHHVTSKDKEIFMLVEKDYPLRKGLTLVMICYKLQVENFSQMENDLVLKIYKIVNSLRQQGD
nr:hypothetical protein [Tanacetum cinerariifolium]